MIYKREHSPITWKDDRSLRNRPKSHSPTPQPYRKYQSQSNHSHSPVSNSRTEPNWFSQTRQPFQMFQPRRFNYHRGRHWNNFYRPPYYNNYRRNPYKPCNQPSLMSPTDMMREQTSQTNPKSQHATEEDTSVSKIPISDVRSTSTKDTFLREAQDVYQTDRRTIAEVTQMLINEDKDLEDRLVQALENILVRLKKAHDKHISYISSITAETK